MRARDLAYQSRGFYQADYLTVEHETVVELRDEFILLGRETNTGKVLKHIHTMYQSYNLGLVQTTCNISNSQRKVSYP